MPPWSARFHERRASRRLRDSTRALLHSLDIPSPMSVTTLCGRLGERRGRAIQLREFPFDVPGPTGAWIATSTTDVVLYQARTTPVHQNHIILHEIGHIIRGHGGPGSAGVSGAVLDTLFPHLPRDAVRWSLSREHCDSGQEREAELVAITIMEWASVLDHVAVGQQGDPRLDRVRDALDNGPW